MSAILIDPEQPSRRCDDRCHSATPGTRCACVCGGRYHAATATVALQRLESDLAAGLLSDTVQRAYELAREGDPLTLAQSTLFAAAAYTTGQGSLLELSS